MGSRQAKPYDESRHQQYVVSVCLPACSLGLVHLNFVTGSASSGVHTCLHLLIMLFACTCANNRNVSLSARCVSATPCAFLCFSGCCLGRVDSASAYQHQMCTAYTVACTEQSYKSSQSCRQHRTAMACLRWLCQSHGLLSKAQLKP